MFQPNWPSSGVQVVMVKDCAAYYNAVFFPPIVVASGYFSYMGYHQFYLSVLGFHMIAFGFVWFVAALNVLPGTGIMLCVDWPCNPHNQNN
jgi:hypothetical protein